jgi:hypothetical protein
MLSILSASGKERKLKKEGRMLNISAEFAWRIGRKRKEWLANTFIASAYE